MCRILRARLLDLMVNLQFFKGLHHKNCCLKRKLNVPTTRIKYQPSAIKRTYRLMNQILMVNKLSIILCDSLWGNYIFNYES